mmetsp:Transcript_121302/g.388552  ORF Transcript_121302/g.388552 Transcript_121302/m.388552 type:complete len:253 (-) Transcript_121302:200-958(-)
MATRGAFAALVLLSQLGVWGSAAQGVAGGRLRALQWNPHWQCFENSADCKAHVERALTGYLSDAELGLDFANLIEFSDGSFSPPAGWVALPYATPGDNIALYFNSRKWARSPNNGSYATGCMIIGDRPFVIQAFDSIATGFSVVVVGAHFPHPDDYPGAVLTLGAALKSVLDAAGVDDILLIADTNLDASVNGTNKGLMQMLEVPMAAHIVGTAAVNTCCLNDGFSYASDRVIANFGQAMAAHGRKGNGCPF